MGRQGDIAGRGANNTKVPVVGVTLNPINLSSILKIPGLVAAPLLRNFKSLFDRFYFTDLERERKRAEVDLIREDVRAKRIANCQAAFGLAEKFPDSETRRRFLETLVASASPFEPVLAQDSGDDQERPRLVHAAVEPNDD